MRRTLYLKFLLAYLIFGIFGFVIVATFVSRMTQDYLIRTESDRLYSEATQVANTFAADLYNNETSLDSAKKQLDALRVYTNAHLWIINPSGRMILSTEQPVDVEKETIVEGFDPTAAGNSHYVIGRFFNYFDSDHLSVLSPITSDFKLKGYVVIHYPMRNIETERESLLAIDYLMLVILFLLSLIILIFFTDIVYIPINKITKATEQYAAGNFHYELQMDSDDEIGYLGVMAAYMAQEIARQEDDQKRFVANVSHDFRSPLTSIKGYLEAMMDGTIPPEDHEKYLGIVLNETERLRKLTNGLLTLNNLNTAGMLLDITVFDINEVIRSVAAAFEGTCRSKKIAIELILTDEKFYVSADVEKIKQVLYNLVDNAIKFSHNDSVIRIETSEKKSKVFVSVKDSGIGIPKDALNQIFDRFYKSDLSRGKDKKGTGLGLAITREIIRAHGENINVISTEGIGSEFIFSLPVADVNDPDEEEV
ncbi:MAG: GHKL domain-containing protein [Lachnospiraceae bacterium]|nr:GHKL domain-containing protein [Lachnospiraceae bacterium]